MLKLAKCYKGSTASYMREYEFCVIRIFPCQYKIEDAVLKRENTGQTKTLILAYLKQCSILYLSHLNLLPEHNSKKFDKFLPIHWHFCTYKNFLNMLVLCLQFLFRTFRNWFLLMKMCSDINPMQTGLEVTIKRQIHLPQVPYVNV